MTTTRCCINHRDYIHIRSIYHIPCTHKRHPIPHFHEWGNDAFFIGDSFENTDHIRKKLDITIRFASFSLSWIYCCYTAISSAESREVCLHIIVLGSWCNIYIYIKQWALFFAINAGADVNGKSVWILLYPRRFNWFHLVRLPVRSSALQSVCRPNHVCFVSSIILTGSISYLHILSSNFRSCVACNFFLFQNEK